MNAAWYSQGRRSDVLVVLVALIARLWVLIDGMDAPTFHYPVVDAATYDLAARSLAGGEGLDWRFFWQPFLYPVSLASVYAVSGGSILVAKILQLLVGVATCWLTLRVGRRLLGPGTGLIAGMICALHGPMIFFETELLATGWAAFWAILLIDRFTLARPEDGLRSWALTGVFCALAVLTRPTFLPVVVVAIVIVLWGTRGRALLSRAGTVVAGFILLVLPVVIMGASTADHASFVPASGAMNLYLGNHYEPCETLTIRPGEAWKELTARAGPSAEGDLVANRAFFRERLSENLTGHPGAVLRGLGRKSIQLVSSRELPRNVDPYLQREWSSSLSVLMFRVGNLGFPMGLLLPLAGLGAWSVRRRVPLVFLVFVAGYLLAVIAVFVSARYRMPMVPALSILAAAGVVSLFVARSPKTILAMLVAVLAMGAVSVVPGPFCEEEVDYRAETLYAVGRAQQAAGESTAAATSYAEALEQRPDYVELLNQYAVLRSQQGRTAEAIDLWLRAVRIDPDHLTVRLNLARAYAVQERHPEALEQFDAALRIEPSNANALLGAGFALLGVARFDEGVEYLERAIRRNPRNAARMPVVIDALRGRGREDLAMRLEAEVRRAGGR